MNVISVAADLSNVNLKNAAYISYYVYVQQKYYYY